MQVSAPGRYRLVVPSIRGFAPTEPVEIEIPAGEYVTYSVTLRRD